MASASLESDIILESKQNAKEQPRQCRRLPWWLHWTSTVKSVAEASIVASKCLCTIITTTTIHVSCATSASSP